MTEVDDKRQSCLSILRVFGDYIRQVCVFLCLIKTRVDVKYISIIFKLVENRFKNVYFLVLCCYFDKEC